MGTDLHGDPINGSNPPWIDYDSTGFGSFDDLSRSHHQQPPSALSADSNDNAPSSPARSLGNSRHPTAKPASLNHERTQSLAHSASTSLSLLAASSVTSSYETSHASWKMQQSLRDLGIDDDEIRALLEAPSFAHEYPEFARDSNPSDRAEVGAAASEQRTPTSREASRIARQLLETTIFNASSNSEPAHQDLSGPKNLSLHSFRAHENRFQAEHAFNASLEEEGSRTLEDSQNSRGHATAEESLDGSIHTNGAAAMPESTLPSSAPALPASSEELTALFSDLLHHSAMDGDLGSIEDLTALLAISKADITDGLLRPEATGNAEASLSHLLRESPASTAHQPAARMSAHEAPTGGSPQVAPAQSDTANDCVDNAALTDESSDHPRSSAPPARASPRHHAGRAYQSSLHVTQLSAVTEESSQYRSDASASLHEERHVSDAQRVASVPRRALSQRQDEQISGLGRVALSSTSMSTLTSFNMTSAVSPPASSDHEGTHTNPSSDLTPTQTRAPHPTGQHDGRTLSQSRIKVGGSRATRDQDRSNHHDDFSATENKEAPNNANADNDEDEDDSFATASSGTSHLVSGLDNLSVAILGPVRRRPGSDAPPLSVTPLLSNAEERRREREATELRSKPAQPDKGSNLVQESMLHGTSPNQAHHSNFADEPINTPQRVLVLDDSNPAESSPAADTPTKQSPAVSEQQRHGSTAAENGPAFESLLLESDAALSFVTREHWPLHALDTPPRSKGYPNEPDESSIVDELLSGDDADGTLEEAMEAGMDQMNGFYKTEADLLAYIGQTRERIEAQLQASHLSRSQASSGPSRPVQTTTANVEHDDQQGASEAIASHASSISPARSGMQAFHGAPTFFNKLGDVDSTREEKDQGSDNVDETLTPPTPADFRRLPDHLTTVETASASTGRASAAEQPALLSEGLTPGLGYKILPRTQGSSARPTERMEASTASELHDSLSFRKEAPASSTQASSTPASASPASRHLSINDRVQAPCNAVTSPGRQPASAHQQAAHSDTTPGRLAEASPMPGDSAMPTLQTAGRPLPSSKSSDVQRNDVSLQVHEQSLLASKHHEHTDTEENPLQLPDAVDFGVLTAYGSYQQAVDISNLTSHWLLLQNSVSASEPAFSVTPDSLLLGPHQSASVQVTVAPDHAGAFRAYLHLKAERVRSDGQPMPGSLIRLTRTLRAVAEEPEIDVTPCGRMDLGVLLPGELVCHQIQVRAAGRAQCTVAICVDSPESSAPSPFFLCLEPPAPVATGSSGRCIGEAAESAVATVARPATQLLVTLQSQSQASGPFGSALLAQCSIYVCFRAVPGEHYSGSTAAVDEEFRSRLRVQLPASYSKQIEFESVSLVAAVSRPHLQVPRVMQAIVLSAAAYSASHRRLPVRNASSIPARVQADIVPEEDPNAEAAIDTHPWLECFSVTPSEFELGSMAVQELKVTYRGDARFASAAARLRLRLTPGDLTYSASLRGYFEGDAGALSSSSIRQAEGSQVDVAQATTKSSEPTAVQMRRDDTKARAEARPLSLNGLMDFPIPETLPRPSQRRQKSVEPSVPQTPNGPQKSMPHSESGSELWHRIERSGVEIRARASEDSRRDMREGNRARDSPPTVTELLASESHVHFGAAPSGDLVQRSLVLRSLHHMAIALRLRLLKNRHGAFSLVQAQSGGQLYNITESITLRPGEDLVLTLAFEPQERAVYRAGLSIQTLLDDHPACRFVIPLRGIGDLAHVQVLSAAIDLHRTHHTAACRLLHGEDSPHRGSSMALLFEHFDPHDMVAVDLVFRNNGRRAGFLLGSLQDHQGNTLSTTHGSLNPEALVVGAARRHAMTVSLKVGELLAKALATAPMAHGQQSNLRDGSGSKPLFVGSLLLYTGTEVLRSRVRHHMVRDREVDVEFNGPTARELDRYFLHEEKLVGHELSDQVHRHEWESDAAAFRADIKCLRIAILAQPSTSGMSRPAESLAHRPPRAVPRPVRMDIAVNDSPVSRRRSNKVRFRAKAAAPRRPRPVSGYESLSPSTSPGVQETNPSTTATAPQKASPARSDATVTLHDSMAEGAWTAEPSELVCSTSETTNFFVRNTGSTDLTYRLIYSNRGIRVRPDSATVEPGEQVAVRVVPLDGNICPRREQIFVLVDGEQRDVTVDVIGDTSGDAATGDGSARDTAKLTPNATRARPHHEPTDALQFESPRSSMGPVTSIHWTPARKSRATLRQLEHFALRLRFVSPNLRSWLLTSFAAASTNHGMPLQLLPNRLVFDEGHARTVKAGVGPVFAVERHSGTIEPHATRHISVSFFGRDVGQTTQFWTLRYTAQKISNETEDAVPLTFVALGTAFMLRHAQVTLRPMSFVMLPVDYRPREAGTQEGHVLVVQATGQKHSVSLSGKCEAMGGKPHSNA
ncbi:uncharacterized protein MONBRDRAFT_11927 [Monosiga brevicollis MX1]|uniref:Uncharacterized protein n=1 Tax=Monosiga brevicollis TaxID=81824 RepID=A9VAP8_MONBE|nr:uncharacterized protein MONBRDRAFT_11927 [Monosiga brevicollis MX1]EDQ85411.1 predicted protein [Monosiga brevicollis MX1]|eukprot:XP_001749822.1 hypothetical protein [Monosiga brevicollis MX1]